MRGSFFVFLVFPVLGLLFFFFSSLRWTLSLVGYLGLRWAQSDREGSLTFQSPGSLGDWRSIRC